MTGGRMSPSFVGLQLLLTLAAVADCRLDSSTVIIDSGVNAPWAFVPIGAENVTALVLEDEQSAWVLVFHDGWLFQPFREAADQLRGLIRFGLVHQEDLATAQRLKFNPSSRAKFRALPCGPAERKLSDFLDTDVFDEAIEHASASVPADSLAPVTDEDSLKRLLTEAVSSVPTKFTAIFAIRDSTPTLLQRSLANKLSNVFNFGLLTRARPHEPLDRVGLGGYSTPVPGLMVLQMRAATSSGSGPDGNSLATIEISRLDESGIAGAGDRAEDGDDEEAEVELNYADALRFLVEYNRHFRAELPGQNQANLTEVRLLTPLLSRERLAFGIFDFSDRLGESGAAGPADEEPSSGTVEHSEL